MSNQRANVQIGFTLIMFAVVVGVIFLIHTVMQGVVSGGGAAADMTEAAVAERIAPVAQLNTGAPMMPAASGAAAAPATAAPAAARSGEAVYKSACFACHATGAAGAPKFGDKAAWAPRIATGMDTLVKNAINGIRAMPPRGTCGTCSDGEMRKAVEYMVNGSK